MADPLFLSFLLLLLFPFLFIISIGAQSNNPTFPTCPSYICGNLNISYPFWRIDNDDQTQYCGYQGFGIDCSNINGTDRPIIKFPDNSYYVDKIFYEAEARSIVLIDENVSPISPLSILERNRCPTVPRNIDFQSLPLNFTLFNVNLSFHINCDGIPGFASEIPCLESSSVGRKSCVNFMTPETEDFDWSDYSCSEHVIKTVFGKELPEPNRLGTEYGRVLSRGFELKFWLGLEDCAKCEKSNGRCGYNNSTRESMCFCSDGRTTTDHCSKGSNLKIKVIIGVLCTGFGVLSMCIFFYFYRRRISKKRYSYGSSYMSRNIFSYPSSMSDPEKDGTYNGVQIFKYKELEKATNYFDPNNELGDGGFGTVYKGKLRDGRVVAVKRLYENNYKRVEQFMNEIRILAGLHHQNLVCLYGCTTHHGRELLLVYEYIPNGTVADHLHGEKSSPGSLPWTTRMSIAIETASALVYLHHSDVIHRDVKTNNILLDKSFTVKVADFGLSRLFPDNVTHVSTAPQGTPGYVDPEYHECYQLTSKSDVYSFGVVLIELISSKPAVDITRHRHEINLSNMAINKIRNDAVHELVDPNLGFETDYEVRKMVHGVAELAFQCLQNERDCRPSMDEVLEGLNGIKNGYEKPDVLDGTSDDAVLLKNPSQAMSPDSVAIAWSTSTTSTSSG